MPGFRYNLGRETYGSVHPSSPEMSIMTITLADILVGIVVVGGFIVIVRKHRRIVAARRRLDMLIELRKRETS
jgi:hypothetical protein